MSVASNPIPDPKTILVVDDDLSVLTVIKCMLENGDYNLLLAHSAESALRMVERDDLTIDLMLIDVVMPDMGGFDLAQVTEMPEVHTKHGHVVVSDEIDGAEHRAVATEAHGQVETLGERLDGTGELRQTGDVGVDVRETHLVALRCEPRRCFARQARRVLVDVMQEKTDRGHDYAFDTAVNGAFFPNSISFHPLEPFAARFWMTYKF